MAKTLPIYLYGHPVLRNMSEDITPDYPKMCIRDRERAVALVQILDDDWVVATAPRHREGEVAVSYTHLDVYKRQT